MVTNITLTTSTGGCGMTVPVTAHGGSFQAAARILVRDAINTLTRLDRPVKFELYWEPHNRIAGWRA
jgi:hypothetical protein